MSKLCFAGSVTGEPWWSIGRVVAAVLAPAGYEVDVSTESYSHHNLEWVHSGRAQLGATTTGHFAKARARSHKYAAMDVIDVSAMRALAVITRPEWLALAFRADSGVTDLATAVAEKRGIRLLGSVEPTGALHTLLDHYGTSAEQLTQWGGTVWPWKEIDAVKRGDVDVVFGRLYSGFTPHMATWYRAAVSMDLTFSEFPAELVQAWVDDNSYRPATLPRGFFPGVARDLPTVGTDQVVIYGKASLSNELVQALVRGIDEKSALFLNSSTPLWYERSKVASDVPIPLHPAAVSYYHEAGYLADPAGSNGG